MRGGELDEIINLQMPSESLKSGELSLSYIAVADVWAKLTSEKGSEAFESARQNARETLRVKLRYRDDVDVKWRFLWDGQTYNITLVDRSDQFQGDLWLTAECMGVL